VNDEIQAPCGGKVPGAKPPSDETIERMWRFAERIAPAKFLPPELRNDPASLFYAIATGEDLGLKWTHATRSFFPSRDGGLGTKGDIMLSLLLVKGFAVDFAFTTEPIGCTCTIIRPGDETGVERTFTMDDARRIQTIWDAKKEAWLTLADDYFYVNFAKEMTQWRSLAMCARVAAPDVLSGLYLVDELGRGVEKPGTNPSQPAAAPPSPDEFKVGEKPEPPADTASAEQPEIPIQDTQPIETEDPNRARETAVVPPEPSAEPPTQPVAALPAEPTFDELIAAVTSKIGGEVKPAHKLIARYFLGFLGVKSVPKDHSKLMPALVKLVEVVDNKIGDLKADPEGLGAALAGRSKGVLASELEMLKWPVNVVDLALKVMAQTKQTEEEFVEWIQSPIVEGTSLASLEPAALEIFFAMFLLVQARAFELLDFVTARKHPVAATLQTFVNCASKPIAEWDAEFCGTLLDEVKKIASEPEAAAPAPTDDDWMLK
jgi:hypothetical protein